MTRKTYRELAKEIGRLLAVREDTNDEITWELIGAMMSAMKEDNPKFDRDVFTDAIEASKKETFKRWDDRAVRNLTNSIVMGNG